MRVTSSCATLLFRINSRGVFCPCQNPVRFAIIVSKRLVGQKQLGHIFARVSCSGVPWPFRVKMQKIETSAGPGHL